MAGKIVADIIESAGSQISLNVGNVTILTASSTGLTLIPTTNVNVNLTNSIVTLTPGSSTGPGLTFSGNTRTGLFMPAANTVAFTAANTEVMRIDSSGNVGIGTNSPLTYSGTALVINGSRPNLRLTNPTTGVTALDGGEISQLGSDLIIENREAGNIISYTNGSERMRITSAGKVGIGNSSPDAQNLHVGASAGGGSINGYTRFAVEASDYSVTTIKSPAANFSQIIFTDPTTTNLGGINFYNSSNATPNAMAFCTGGGSERMRIISSGQVGINATPASGNTFRVINIGTDNACQFGNASNGVYLPYASPTAWSSYSDARLKDVIGNYENALDHILQLNPVKYTWKSDANKKVNIGLLAQNVLEVIPEIVDENTLPNDEEDKTNYLSLRYTDLIPVLIGSIQELKAIVDAQAVEIAALKAK